MLTCDDTVGEDVSKLFNQLSGYAPRSTYQRLLVAPRSLRWGLVQRIEQEIANAQAGIDSRVVIKVNSMVDETIIDACTGPARPG